MDTTLNKRTMLLTRSPLRLMISLSIPGIIGMLVIGLYTLVDAIYAGHLIGVTAMGSIAVAYPFTFVNSGLSTLIGMGSSSVLSRAIGAHDHRVINQVMGNLVMLSVTLSLIVTVLGMIFARQLLELTGVEGEMLTMGVAYLRILFIGSIFVNFAQASNMILRAEGEVARAMWIMGGGAVLNIVLAPLFILALRERGLGIEGAAIATVISEIILAFVMLWWFIKKEKTARIVKLAFSRNILSEVLKVGSSSFLMQVLVLVQQAIMYRCAASWGGSEWQVLFGAALRIQSFAFIPLFGLSTAFQPVVGTSFGADQFHRVRKIMMTFCGGATVISLLFWIPVMLAPEASLSLFITDPEIVARGVTDFRIFFAPYLMMGVMIIVITFFQALGKSGQAALLVIARPIILFIPLVLTVPHLAGLGIHGVWVACALTDVVVPIVGIALMAHVMRTLPRNDKELLESNQSEKLYDENQTSLSA